MELAQLLLLLHWGWTAGKGYYRCIDYLLTAAESRLAEHNTI